MGGSVIALVCLVYELALFSLDDGSSVRAHEVKTERKGPMALFYSDPFTVSGLDLSTGSEQQLGQKGN